MFRGFIKTLEDRNIIKEIEKVVSVKYQIAAYMKKYDGHVLFFKNVKEYESWKVISGVVGSKDVLYLALGTNKDTLYSVVEEAAKKPSKPKMIDSGAFMENKTDSLFDLPILTHYERDSGPYLTSAIVYAEDIEENVQNVSFHRMMVIDEKHMAIRIVPRHLYQMFKKAKTKNKDLPISIVIGVHPAILISASYPVSYGVNETWVANTLLKNQLRTTSSPINNIEVPAHSEIVIEGKILHNKTAKEGPFVDITGSYDIVREQPIVEVGSIFYRSNPIYHALLPAGREHKILMGLPKEIKIYNLVKNVVPKVYGVNLTSAAGGWLHAVISIQKQADGDAKNAIMAAFTAHPSLKHCVVVDPDIDINNPEDVEWAIATRFQADKDLVVIPNARGSSLDPSADQETLRTTKVGVDATIPLDRNKEHFVRARIPVDVDS